MKKGNKHLVKCSADTHDLFEYFDLICQEEDCIEEEYPSLNSWIVGALGKIPEEGRYIYS